MPVITAAQAKFLHPSLSGTGADTDIESAIDLSDALIADYLGFGRDHASTPRDPTLELGSHTFYLAGEEWVQGRKLQLPVWPIGAVTTIEDDPGEDFDGSSYLVDSGDYTVRKADGVVLLTQDSTWSWSRGSYETIKAVYTAGWTAGSLPENVRHAVAVQAAHLLNTRGVQGVQSMQSGNASVTPVAKGQALLPEVRHMVDSYRCARRLL